MYLNQFKATVKLLDKSHWRKVINKITVLERENYVRITTDFEILTLTFDTLRL